MTAVERAYSAVLNDVDDINGATLAKWTGLDGDDYGQSLAIPLHTDKTVAITGTFDSATVVIQGSLDGTNWFTLTDPQGNAISKTAAALEAVTENVLYIRPNVSGGGGSTALVVTILATGA